ncbi:ADP-ribose diphosphatase [Ktedonobacteria bacterium brp13]|nr:ADP-ribose diphosphatase [Ktedonobacteria bacterium brp13]
MEKKVDVQDQSVIFDDKFKIREAHVRYMRFDGQMSNPERRLVFERGDSAAAIIVNSEQKKVLLTNQFRYPAYSKDADSGWVQEVVAGVIDEGEQPEETIRREIQEEIGYTVHELTPIATFFVSPGGTSERVFLYYAEVDEADRTSQGGGLISENEDIQLVALSFDELWQQLRAGTLVDAKTLIAAQWLLLRIQQGEKRFS